MQQPLVKEKIMTRDFVLICMANFFIFLGFQMSLPTIPLFVESLGGSDQLVGLVVGFFTFSALITRSYAGNALETKGRKVVYMLGLVIFAISMGSYAFTTAIWFLFFMRMIQGIGWGCSGTASGTIASDFIPASRRGEGMGLFALGGNFALAIGPGMALVLSDYLSFKIIFFISAACGVIALLLSSQIRYRQVSPPEKKETKKHIFYEKSSLKPASLMFFITLIFGGIAAFLPLHTKEQGVYGIQFYFTCYALALLLTRFFAGKLYDRKGIAYVFPPGCVMIMIAMLLLSWLPNTLVLLLAAMLYGFGFGIVQPALQAWVIARAPVDRRGMATATFFSAFDLGVGCGAVLFGQISHYFGYRYIYLSSAISIFCALLLHFYYQKEIKN